MRKKLLTTIIPIVVSIILIVLLSIPTSRPPSSSGTFEMALFVISITSMVFGILSFTKLQLWAKLLFSIIAGPVLFWILVAVAFKYGDIGLGSQRLPLAEAEKFENWKTYKGSGFEMKYPDENGVLLIAQRDGRREFLFGGVSCGNSEKESSVLGSINFYPVIEGGYDNSRFEENSTKTIRECDNLLTRWILHGRFCTDKNLSKYQVWCDEGSEKYGYNRYDIYLACSWPGEKGRIKCNQIFDQSLSTFKFTE